MTAKYILRLDDISSHMHWENYERLREIFDRWSVRPLIGVIPQNEDPALLKYPARKESFWREIRERHQAGWHVAVHGFRHVYDRRDPGLLGVSKVSEFAGHSYEEQFSRLSRARDILIRESLPAATFMAPSHSFDYSTLRALRALGFTAITDGFALFPYERDGLLFVPQLTANPSRFWWGVLTFCLHPNEMSGGEVDEVERFIAENRSSIIPFESARDFVRNTLGNSLSGAASRFMLNLKRRLLPYQLPE
jgi:predicted deacetylase